MTAGTGEFPEQDLTGPPDWRRVAAAFSAAVRSGRLDLPLPGRGQTMERWAAFASLAEEDLSLARLSEGHADALAILAELGGPGPPRGSRWGVWAAHPPGPGSEAVTRSRRLGAAGHQAVLLRGPHVHARAGDGGGRRRQAAVRGDTTEPLKPCPGTWPATGMAGSDTLDVAFADIQAEEMGRPERVPRPPGVHARRRRSGSLLVRRGSRDRPGPAGGKAKEWTSARTRWLTWARSTSR